MRYNTQAIRMSLFEFIIVLCFGLGALSLFLKSVYEIVRKKNPYGQANYGILYGGFVFADYLIFGAFFTLVALAILLLGDFLLFLLIYSVFWMVRSVGEALYWFLQQFSTLTHKNPPQRYLIYRVVKSDAVWFVNQIIWQCLTVIFVITTIYLSAVWIRSL